MNVFTLCRRLLVRTAFLAAAALATAYGEPSPPAATPDSDSASVTAGLTPEGGRIVVEAKGMAAPVPLFFSASVDQHVRLGSAEIAGEMRIRLHILQGRP